MAPIFVVKIFVVSNRCDRRCVLRGRAARVGERTPPHSQGARRLPAWLSTHLIGSIRTCVRVRSDGMDDDTQRAVLGLLLKRHPRMLDLDEIRHELAGFEGIDFAIEQLSGDGLLNRLGGMAGASRCAARMHQLTAP